MQLRSAARTDIGQVRYHNEDRLLCDDALRLYGVADGIGGLPRGADAAQLAVELVQDGIRDLAGGACRLANLVREINAAVVALGRRVSPHRGIGTTLTFGLFRDGHLDLAHVGDSRCYCLRNEKLACLTTDHSVENEARAKAAQGRPYWYNPLQGGALTRCIGQFANLEIDTFHRRLRDGDRYLFCSDGITKQIDETELATLLAAAAAPDEIIRGLVDLASRRGGYDNASAVLVFVDKAE
ncbi:MAG: protein phosphatase 2C domain-containing protein [Opitutaceae bacterium]|jgi:protein phosphatase|nr:protein phosphatase 2C domain-containing protein [Opitutaceae bacterium]